MEKLIIALGLVLILIGVAYCTDADAAPREVQAGYTCHWENRFVSQEWVCD